MINSDEEYRELLYLRYYYKRMRDALDSSYDGINQAIAEGYEGDLPESIKEELEE